MINIVDKKACCGCTACVNICSHDAIQMVFDEYGFVFPKVDESKCIGCGLCDKVCPLGNDVDSNYPAFSFVATAKDSIEQLSSASGGACSAIARYIIKELGGIVYGCSGKDCFHIQHIRVDKESDLPLIKGSKYVQSDLGNTYRSVRNDLRAGKLVLFIGTPCQVAGLKKFLLRPYESLYCIDFVCHGVPSQQMLSDYVRGLDTANRVQTVEFREKKKDRIYYCLSIKGNNGLLSRRNFGFDLYLTAFLLGLTYRDSCYSCKFATENRVSDITVGDYWDKHNEFASLPNCKKGLSQININTEKGGLLFDKVGKLFNTSSINFNKLLAHSEQLKEPFTPHPHRNQFLNMYKFHSFNDSCKSALSKELAYYKRTLLTRYIYMIPGTSAFVKIVKKIVKL